MKYIKTYDKNEFYNENEYFKKIPLILYKLSQSYFDDFTIRMKHNDSNVSLICTFTEDGYFEKKDTHFLRITFTHKGGELYHIRLEVNYTNMDIYERGEEFKNYICDLIKPLSFNHDHGYDYFVHGYKMDKLLPLLSISEYEIYKDTNKYNL